MDRLEFIKFLDSKSTSELQDYLEAFWHGDVELDLWEEQTLLDRIQKLKVEKVEDYVIVWLVLLALINIDDGKTTPITSIFNKLSTPTLSDEYDLIWVTKNDGDVCELCDPLDGKIYGVDFTLKPKLHPNCRCELKKLKKARRAMKIRTLEAGAVRAIESDGVRQLEVLAAPFGSARNKDKYKQWFDKDTDFMIEIGDRRPTLYLHGKSPRGRSMDNPPTTGVSTLSRIDEFGYWMISDLDDSELSNRQWESALKGEAVASTGSIGYLVRPPLKNGQWPPGPVKCWPIAELSIFDGGEGRVPISDDALVIPLRALFAEHDIDYTFEAGEDKNDSKRANRIDKKDNKMDPKELKEAFAAMRAEEKELEVAEAEKETAMRAKIEKELKEKPNYRATFNINDIDDKEAKKDAVKEENFAFVRGLIQDAKIVAQGGTPRYFSGLPSDSTDAKRVLEETEAAELQSMVPEDLHNKIHGLLGKYSLVDKMAAKGLMTIYKTDKLIFNVPAETTAMTLLADIAEEGAYVANEMAFAAKTATMQKVGNYLSVTEEALEDQDLFQQYLVKACAKAIALSKNLDLHTLMDAIAGTAIGTTDVITDAEVIANYYALPQEYREGSAFIMNDLTLAYIRAMLIATPRAYGEFGFAPMSMGELGEFFLNKPVFTNDNWVALVGGATNDAGVSFANFDECIYWVERRKMSIFVDPYSTKLSAGTVNFLPSARYAGVTVNAAAASGIELLS